MEEIKNEDTQSTGTAESIDFTKIVKQQEKTIAQTQSVAAPKGKRGGARPNAGRKPNSEAAQSNSESHIQSTQSNAVGTDQTTFQTAGNAAQPPPVVNNYVPFIKPQLKQVGKMVAHKYKCPDLALTDEESESLSEALNNFINVMVPDLGTADPKTQATVGLVLTTLAIFAGKVQVYKEHQANQMTTPQAA